MPLYWDTASMAEGICNSTPTGSIECLLDELRFIIEPGCIIDDAIQYRRSDDDGEDGDNDNEQADRYRETENNLRQLIEAIEQREKEEG